ncbi:fumarylacetoacetate hydrolase family protein [Actibacterium sp. D379-3]
MRFASIRKGGKSGIALCDADGGCRAAFAGDATYPGSLDALVAQGPDALKAAGTALASAPDIGLDGVEFLSPLVQAPKIICIGLNYKAHAMESGLDLPEYPVIFARYNSSLIGHNAPIIRPRVSEQLDYEGELVVVIGKGGRDIPEADALDHVIAYSAFNDASIRDYQLKTHQWTIGKTFDDTGAFGPWLVTPDELPAGCKGLKLETRLNGEVVQSTLIDDLIFDVPRLIAILSEAMTLEPGDVIVTGTPSGVGIARDPKLWMKPGDICEVEIDGIGILSNPIADQ